jgi:cell division protein ZapA
MKQIEAQIMQQSYLLVCPEGREERLMQAVQRLDAAMMKIRDAGKVKARDRIAVLAALNFAFELGERDLNSAAPVSTTTDPSDAPAQAGQQRLQQLMNQLDAALGEDGFLI